MSLRYTLRRNVTGLTRFSGRERPGAFWPYAGVVMGSAMLVWAVPFLASFAGTMRRVRQFAASHPDQVTVTQGPGSYSLRIHGSHPELMADLDRLIPILGAITASVVLLLAAAVARRLHDRGMSGSWGLMPLPFLITGMLGMTKMFDRFAQGGAPPLGLFFLTFLNNLIYLALVATLIVLLVRRSDPGPNRFGPPPF